MKKRFALPLLLLLASCSRPIALDNTPSVSPTPSITAPASITVDEFSLSQISGGGCGMTLWRPDRTANDRFIFFNGLQPQSMEMRINGQMMQFDRIQASGTEIYGQSTSQIFRSQNGFITVQVNVTLGKRGEIETVDIPEGSLRVLTDDSEITIPVVGNAGC
ncbi:MAG TPA: hypothetical protein V6C84_05225 [Coleofasciculaceae cyanobacterium]|jgi:hypothetical protein